MLVFGGIQQYVFYDVYALTKGEDTYDAAKTVYAEMRYGRSILCVQKVALCRRIVWYMFNCCNANSILF